jgi:hypothetical protein
VALPPIHGGMVSKTSTRPHRNPIPVGPHILCPLATIQSTPSQGLTLVHFSAQLELCLTQENTFHTLNPP